MLSYKLFGVLLVDFGLFFSYWKYIFFCCRRRRCRRRRSWFGTHKMHGKTERTRTEQFKRIKNQQKIIIKMNYRHDNEYTNHKQSNFYPNQNRHRFRYYYFIFIYASRLYSYRLSVVLFCFDQSLLILLRWFHWWLWINFSILWRRNNTFFVCFYLGKSKKIL